VTGPAGMKGSNFCLHDARQMLEADTKHDLQEIAMVVVSGPIRTAI
jgi:hypothetical protein